MHHSINHGTIIQQFSSDEKSHADHHQITHFIMNDPFDEIVMLMLMMEWSLFVYYYGTEDEEHC